jgi:hypothetical protein
MHHFVSFEKNIIAISSGGIEPIKKPVSRLFWRVDQINIFSREALLFHPIVEHIRQSERRSGAGHKTTESLISPGIRVLFLLT